MTKQQLKTAYYFMAVIKYFNAMAAIAALAEMGWFKSGCCQLRSIAAICTFALFALGGHLAQMTYFHRNKLVNEEKK
ncbi:hypothetical protein [Neisseria chenwenguii]|uniref:hypothetical protein n=1 Tax=Neisseria chenwenguii TaxID=1853278 RepID=UPI000F4DDA8B|nr:hypothetical protein [Neisseria chenwenguii]ROV56230.1 hypothetical protein EGS38_05780 [Neisseria chenwenguii]